MSSPNWSSARAIRAGILITGLCVVGSLFWALTAQVQGAVVASGVVEVDNRSQSIQHPDGGTVEAIAVRNGDQVLPGQPVLILYSGDLLEQRRVVMRQLFETRLTMDRLRRETGQRESLQFPPDLVEYATAEPELLRRLEEERQHFAAWRALQDAREQQLSGRRASFEATLDGLLRQQEALSEARAFAVQRLAERRALLARGLERSTVIAQLERDRMELDAQIAALEARIAETRGALADIINENRRTVEGQREQALAEYSDLAAGEGELLSQLRLFESRLERQVLRSPVQGVVHDLQVFTQGGVVAAGQTLMTIVPDDQPLILSVRVAPRDIEHVQRDQETQVRFPGLSMRDLQPLSASVRTIAPDVTLDRTTGVTYYAVELSMTDTATRVFDGLTLVPGMPVQANIQTGTRSVLNYLVSPITDFFRAALKES